MKKFLFLTLLLSACATNRLLFVNEKGVPIYQADCGGHWQNLNMGDCLIKASEQCPTGFNILIAHEAVVGTMMGNSLYGDINTTSNLYGNSNSNATIGLNKSGNNIYGNAFGNSSFNAFGNSNTSVNLNSFGGVSNSYSRFIIYACKN